MICPTLIGVYYYSHIGELVRRDLCLVGHVDLLSLMERALQRLCVDVLNHRLVIVATELLQSNGYTKDVVSGHRFIWEYL